MKKITRSGSSHSSAGAQRALCGAAAEASDKTENASGSRKVDMIQQNNMSPRVVVVRPGALGDTLLALPALGALAASHPGATLDLVGYPSVLRLLEHMRPPLPVGRIHSIDRALFGPLLAGTLSEELEEFLASYDLLIAWIGDPSGQLSARLERLPLASLRCDPYPSLGSGMHASRHLLRSLAPLGSGFSTSPVTAPIVEPPRDAAREGRDLLRGLGLREGDFIALHPGSGSPGKNWPAENFADLWRLAQEGGHRVLLIEGPADEEAVRSVVQMVGISAARVRPPSLTTLAAVLSRAAAFVGNDSGVSHLAAATGAPTRAIFGPTDPTVWAPLAPNARVLRFESSAAEVWRELERAARLGRGVRISGRSARGKAH